MGMGPKGHFRKFLGQLHLPQLANSWGEQVAGRTHVGLWCVLGPGLKLRRWGGGGDKGQ